MPQQEPTIATILEELAREYRGIVAEREIFDRVLERRPSQAKDPYASIRGRLRYEATACGWVRLGGGELIPLHVVLDGLRFRIMPDEAEIAAGYLLRMRLYPFVPMSHERIRFATDDRRPFTLREQSVTVGEDIFGSVEVPAFKLNSWYTQVGFQAGDSILVTVTNVEPLTLRIDHEAAANLRRDDILRQEQELLAALVQLVTRNRSNPLYGEESVLPTYARASWRTAYPGRPWQDLVENDNRLRLIDGIMVADGSYRRPLDMIMYDEQQAQRWRAQDHALLADITALQNELLASRREAAEHHLWDGTAPRASTARVIFDSQTGDSSIVYLEPIDALTDYSARIDERLSQGDYANEDWDEASELYDDDDDFDDFDDDEMFSLTEIDDLQGFLDDNPALAEAAQKLMAALSADEVERLQRAETHEDAQQILAHRFHQMLPSEPSLFATLVPYTPDLSAAGNNGGDRRGNPIDAFEEWGDFTLIEDDDLFEEADVAQHRVNGEALAQSSEQIDRFHRHLIAQGKSEATAAARAGDLWIYAEFLANYYNRSLTGGDYATLDECLFFFYPRKVARSSPRAVRELCTSLKQFYAYQQVETGSSDAFAQAIWRRRDQAARTVELYERIDGESPLFEHLFAHLFAPYTA
jgi:hypothetical protein